MSLPTDPDEKQERRKEPLQEPGKKNGRGEKKKKTAAGKAAQRLNPQSKNDRDGATKGGVF